MVVAGNNFPGLSDFHRELINRFFNAKSYFIFSFINELKTQEALLEDPENVAVIGLVVDEIINSPDKIETLFDLTRIPGFDVFYHTLMEKVEYLRVTHLTTNQMMKIVKELGISLAVTFTSIMTHQDGKNQLLSYAGLEKTQASPLSPGQENISGSEKLIEKPVSDASGQNTKPSDLDGLFQAEGKTAEVPDPWDFFHDDVSQKLEAIDKLLAEFKDQPHNRFLLKKVKIAFQELREWAMIQGNDGIETISMRTLAVLNLALRTFGFPLQKVLPDIEESVKALYEVNRSGWAGENLDIVPVVLHKLEGLHKEVEATAQSEKTQKADFEYADLSEALPSDLQKAVEEESDFDLDKEVKSAEFRGSSRENQIEDESGEQVASASTELTEARSDLSEEGSSPEEETSRDSEDYSPPAKEVSEDALRHEDSIQNLPEEETAEKEEARIPILDDSNFSVSEMEELYDEMFPPEEAALEDALVSENGALKQAEDSPLPPEQEIESTEDEATTDSSLEEILDETFLLSEVDEDQHRKTPVVGKEEDISLPGEDDEDLLAVIDELSEELPIDSKPTQEGSTAEPTHNYHANLMENEDEQIIEEPAAPKNDPIPQKKDFPKSRKASLFPRGGKDFVEEAEMYFQFTKRAFSLLRENIENQRAYEDIELACYSLKILARKLGYEYVARIVDQTEVIFKKVLSRELLLKKENISYISDVILKIEELGKQNRLSDKDVLPWASEVLATLSSFEEDFLSRKVEKKENHQEPESDGSKDPLEFLMYDDPGKYFKQLLNE